MCISIFARGCHMLVKVSDKPRSSLEVEKNWLPITVSNMYF